MDFGVLGGHKDILKKDEKLDEYLNLAREKVEEKNPKKPKNKNKKYLTLQTNK